MPNESVGQARKCRTCTIAHKVHLGFVAIIIVGETVDSLKCLENISDLPKKVRFGDGSIFRNKGQIPVLGAPCTKALVLFASSRNKSTTVNVDDNRKLFPTFFMLWHKN